MGAYNNTAARRAAGGLQPAARAAHDGPADDGASA
jgi:hypothetical protein